MGGVKEFNHELNEDLSQTLSEALEEELGPIAHSVENV
jgi:hypothetical protein